MKIKRMQKALGMVALFVAAAVLATPALAQDPYDAPDASFINITGTVESVTSPDTFLLDYDHGMVTVEMDDLDRDADAYKLVEGDKVSVTGRVDDDMFETTTIEAGSVYVEGIDSYFYASSLDEEDAYVALASPIVVSSLTIQGIVTSVEGEEFTVDTGLREMRVEVDEMPYNPLDDEGFQQIDVGDRVSVTGTIDDDFFEGRELVADTIVTIE